MEEEYPTVVRLGSFSDKTMDVFLVWRIIKTIDNVLIDHMGRVR